jgi:hypothetical protein
MSEFILKMDNWDRVGNCYIYPKTPDTSSWRNIGLVPENDYTADLFGWYGFSFETEVHGKETVEVRVGLLDFGEINAEEIIDYYTWKATVCGDGIVKLVAPLNQFDLLSSMPAKWRYLRSVEISRPVKNLMVLKGKGVYAHAHVMSKSADPDGEIQYRLQVVNCIDETQAISFEFEKSGWEVLSPYVTEDEIVLAPFEEKECYIKVVMSDRIVPGGFEKHRVHIVPNGDGNLGQILEFYSVRHMEHPYILHTADGWEKVKDKMKNYAWAEKLANEYIKRAEDWEVPQIGNYAGGMFITKNSEHCYNAATCYVLTGRREFAEKSAEFLRLLSDREAGYPNRMKACSQQLVHEGEFFKYCARAYDIIHDIGVLTQKDHENIHYTFRLFIDFLDWALSDGGISNWSLAEATGALYCAMALQDREKIERFTFGVGGILEHLRAGVMSDGWWCECSIGYNQMVAGLFSECALSLRPWGINIAHWWVNANYSNKVHFRGKHVDGLSWDIYGGTSKNYNCIQDLWDSLVSMANYRSVAQGVNDSSEEMFEGASKASYDSRYDIAYALYRKPEYAKIILNAENAHRDLFYGEAELPDIENDFCHKSCYFDNGGVALLRTNTDGREDKNQIEASLKYGSHGGAHGHYDRCALNAVSRDGRSLFNPENVWYSYGTYMYKFFVQTSITHNMVTVDLKMQDPSEAKRILFYSGRLFQAAAIENNAKWSNPPYGGWRVLNGEKDFEERTWVEGRYLHIPEDAPDYAVRTEFTEPVEQRRCMVLTDDYIVCFDYMKGEEEHDYDCIYHLKGLLGIDGQIEKASHTDRLSDNPLSSAQFITEVDRYNQSGTAVLSFAHEYTEAESGKAPWIGKHPFRSGHNVPGVEYSDLYYISNEDSELIVGCDPEYYPISKRLFYSVAADGETLADGKFGAWIFGRRYIDVDITGRSKLTLHVRTEDGMVDHNNAPETLKSIFWGDPYFILENGEKIYMSEIKYDTRNVDCGNGAGVDYGGGPVKIEMKKYEHAIPADVLDKDKESVITVSLSGMNAVRFVSDIGSDYPVGDESDRRRFVAQRKRGKQAGFISILEPHEKDRMIKHTEYVSNNKIAVELADGRKQIVEVLNMDTGEKICVKVSEYVNGECVRTETSE